ncbi:MAG TPA: SWIM zinc finger domain-containing protein [Nostocaceae cyanobacterium]|nr:SWIM zinc finger domain-containing protein [Nostocaceae cyanobacterium]
MSIFNLSEFTVRRYANAQSYQRGESYFQAGAVISATQYGDLLQAEVEGSENRTYQVTLSCDEEGNISGRCTCPYDWDGWCKHIVATCLVCIHQPESITKHPSLEQMLGSLDHAQTQGLVQALVAEHPELLADISQYISEMINPAEKKTAKPRSVINVDPFRRQIENILEDAASAREEGYYDYYDQDNTDLNDNLENVIDEVWEYINRGQGEDAIAILSAITSACVDNWQDADDYGADRCYFNEKLDLAWTEAILWTEIPPEEKVDLQVELESWQDEWNVDFGLALAALQQGWDDPELVQILSGKYNYSDVWVGNAPELADKLAQIRLKILEQQGHEEEYLYLAKATGQIESYLVKLAQLGKIKEATEAAATEMTSMQEAFSLAKALTEKRELTEALKIAHQGLSLTEDNCKHDLGLWTSELAEELGENEISLLGLKTAFAAKPALIYYQKLEDLAGDKWENLKPELLKTLRESDSWGSQQAKIDIWIYEDLIEEAIAYVEKHHNSSSLVHQVMTAAAAKKPDWVIKNATSRAEAIMDATQSKYYEIAIDWLKKARAAYLASGRHQEWQKYHAELMKIHAKKPKLMKLLKSKDMS